MVIYPFSGPVILNDSIFTEYGGQTGSFSHTSLQNSYWLAEMQITEYIGTPLLPVRITGTYPFMNKARLATDYGYVHRLLNVNLLTRTACNSCDLRNNNACGYIYDDTYGYVDFKRLVGTCNCGGWWWFGSPYPAYTVVEKPYQVQIVYEAGLPTGTANQPGILEALTILAKIDLNEKEPGLVGMNESPGDMGLTRFRSMDYAEGRKINALKETALGNSPQAMRAKRLIDMSITKARKVLLV